MLITVELNKEELTESGMSEVEFSEHIIDTLDGSSDVVLPGYNVKIVVAE